MRISYLNLKICENLYNLISTGYYSNYSEILPAFNTRFPGRVESIIESIKLKSLYLDQDILEVAANYFVSLNRGHPFQNGNKRMSILCTDVFLIINNYILSVPSDVLVTFAISINVEKESDDVIKKVVKDLFKRYAIIQI